MKPNKTRMKEFLELERSFTSSWETLTRISLDVAEKRGIGILCVNLGNRDSRFSNFRNVGCRTGSKIIVYHKGNVVYNEFLLELSKEVEPALYAEYCREKQRYEQMKKELGVA